MADIIYSANMNLPIPVVGVSTGPNYALSVDACFQTIDGHDHSEGFGVQITPAGLNINSDLSLNDNNLIDVKSVRFEAQSSLPAVNPDLLCFYAIGNDIYFNDGAGNAIRITQSGAVTGATGTITGLPSGTASASYSAGSGKFVFQSASNIGADLDAASVIIREKVSSGKGVTLSAPTALAADYTLVLPSALPAAEYFTTINAAGAIGNPIPLALGIATANIANGAVTKVKQAALGQQLSSSNSGTYSNSTASYTDVTNCTVTITTTGRPVFIALVDGAAGSPSRSSVFVTVDGRWKILRDATAVAEGALASAGGRYDIPCSSIFHIDVVGAGTYVYKIQAERVTSGTIGVSYAKLIAYEL